MSSRHTGSRHRAFGDGTACRLDRHRRQPAALLRRFTVQVAQETMDLEEKQYTVQLLTRMGRVAVEPILSFLRSEPEVTWPVRALHEILPKASTSPP